MGSKFRAVVHPDKSAETLVSGTFDTADKAKKVGHESALKNAPCELVIVDDDSGSVESRKRYEQADQFKLQIIRDDGKQVFCPATHRLYYSEDEAFDAGAIIATNFFPCTIRVLNGGSLVMEREVKTVIDAHGDLKKTAKKYSIGERLHQNLIQRRPFTVELFRHGQPRWKVNGDFVTCEDAFEAGRKIARTELPCTIKVFENDPFGSTNKALAFEAYVESQTIDKDFFLKGSLNLRWSSAKEQYRASGVGNFVEEEQVEEWLREDEEAAQEKAEAELKKVVDETLNALKLPEKPSA